MRADTEALLSLRDGEPLDAASLRRLAGCEDSEREVQRLRDCRAALQALPAFDPPAHAWAGVQARLAQLDTQSAPRAAAPLLRRRWPSRAAWLPVAAALGLVALLWPLLAPERIASPAMVDDPVTHAPGLAADVTVRFAALQRQSHEFDELLHALGDPPELVSAGTALTLNGIEGGIALIDDRLNQLGTDAGADAERERLWQQRLELMNALLQLRLAQAQRYAF
ncbi:MAG: hypothetical protein JJU27_16260 [Gammaproteobacteria bacterium]|nr:hypothetical protein [Gammaproteobacteria bacterium]